MVCEQSNNIADLVRDGDYIVALHELKNSVSTPSELSIAALSARLDDLMDVLEIRPDRPLEENYNAISAKPIVALRVARFAAELAPLVQEVDPEQEHLLNVLRRDMILGVAGIPATLDEDAVRGYARHSIDLMYCLLGALSDVAATAPEVTKKRALENYSRASGFVFG